MLINTIDDLRSFYDRAHASDVLAIDTEFLREKTYYPLLCLLQLGTDDEQVAIDPFAVGGVDILRDLFTDPSITKVLHASSQDLEIILQHYGVIPWPMFDTQIAAGFVGDRAQIGYGALVEEYCDVHLPKTEALTDWSRRPLDAQQLQYAYDDVKYLPRIWRTLRSELERLGRLDWVQPEFERACDPETYRHDPRQAWLRLKRVSSLSRRQLAVAREVCAWREQLAQTLDQPRRWIMSDESIIEISKAMPRTISQLERIRGLDSLSAAEKSDVLRAVRTGVSMDEAQLPHEERRIRPSAEQESVCDLMYSLTRKVAEREGLAVTLLASRDDLMGYLCNPASSKLSSGWRHEVIGSKLDDLLNGKLGLTVRNGAVEIL